MQLIFLRLLQLFKIIFSSATNYNMSLYNICLLTLKKANIWYFFYYYKYINLAFKKLNDLIQY